MDIFEQIKTDHQQIKQTVSSLKKLTNGVSKKRESLLGKLKQQLIPHEKAEERVFYPILLHEQKSKEDALEAIEEHHFVNVAMKELERMPKDHEHWHAKLSVMGEMLDHHIKEEEAKIFREAHQLIDDKQAQQTNKLFKQQKSKVKEKLNSH